MIHITKLVNRGHEQPQHYRSLYTISQVNNKQV